MKLKLFDPHETAQMERLKGKPLASFSSRGLAIFIDLIAGTFFCYILTALLALADYTVLHSGPAGESYTRALIRLIVEMGLGTQNSAGDVNIGINPREASLFAAIGLSIFIAFMNYMGNGKTIGKAIMGIRAVSLVHEHLTIWQSIERALGYSVSIAEAGFGFLQYFIHPNRRTVHDRIAETIVIKDRGGESK